jgi:hypothetical protein
MFAMGKDRIMGRLIAALRKIIDEERCIAPGDEEAFITALSREGFEIVDSKYLDGLYDAANKDRS